MPADPREWLPGRHLAWSVLEQVGEMDLSAFGNACRADGQGGKPYDPAVMCGLLLYGYCKGLRSSRPRRPPQQARAVLDAAGITDPIAKAAFDAGYASAANFTAAAEAELYVAVAREGVQTGRSDGPGGPRHR